MAGIVFQCGACRSLVSARQVLTDRTHERAGLACDVCGSVTWLPCATTALDAPQVPALAVAPSIAGAGFSDAQRTRIEARLRSMSPSGPAQEDLSTSFARLLGHWDQDVEHKQLVNKAALLGELAFAGQRYRAVLDEVPGDPQAKRGQSEILGLAMATMTRTKELGALQSGGGNRRFVVIAALVVTVLLCGALIVYLPRFLLPDAPSEIMHGVPDSPAPEPLVGEER